MIYALLVKSTVEAFRVPPSGGSYYESRDPTEGGTLNAWMRR